MTAPLAVKALPGWRPPPAGRAPTVLLAPGEGIGPEVVAATADVLSAVNAALDLGVAVTWLADLGVRGPRGLTVDDRTREAIGSALDAGVPVLTGPAGGRFVYELRAQLGLFCKLVPLRPRPELGDAGVLRTGHASAVDILVVRDNDGGIYQGAFGWAPDGRSAYQEARYDVDQVDRVMDVAIRAAAARSGRLTVVCKPGGLPTITDLWMQRAEEAARRPEGAGVVVDSLEVDNACYQIVADPRRFDVLVTPNLIGDVVADTAALLLGSRGMSLSANYRADGAAVYQTGHGAARDLAGRDVANPLGQIASLSMLLRESLALGHAADAIDAAVGAALASGVRTADIASPGATIVGTRAMGEAVAERVAEVAAGAGDRLGAAAGGRA